MNARPFSNNFRPNIIMSKPKVQKTHFSIYCAVLKRATKKNEILPFEKVALKRLITSNFVLVVKSKQPL